MIDEASLKLLDSDRDIQYDNYPLQSDYSSEYVTPD